MKGEGRDVILNRFRITWVQATALTLLGGLATVLGRHRLRRLAATSGDLRRTAAFGRDLVGEEVKLSRMKL